MTVIPWRIVDELQLQIQIHQLEAVAVEVLADRSEPYVLLERDVLNRHRVVLDGPQLILDLD
jgi:hypothetical protein